MRCVWAVNTAAWEGKQTYGEGALRMISDCVSREARDTQLS
jgi:hypothetical protein